MSIITNILPFVGRIGGRQFVDQSRHALDLYDLGTSEQPPAPQEFVIPDYVPSDCVTSLFAKAGSAKSFLALIIGFHVVLGRSIFERDVLKGPVLYLDAELDQTTAERRAWMIANGLDLERPPHGILYYRLKASLTDPQCNHDIRGEITIVQPRLVIIDSFTAAVRGRDTNSLDDVTERLKWLDNFGTVLIIDHTPKSADFSSTVTAIGSSAKQIFARSSLFIASNGQASILRHEKSNFGPLVEPMRFALNFSAGEVRLEAPLSPNDPRLKDLEEALPAYERIKEAVLSGEYDEGFSANKLAKDFDMKVPTVRNTLTKLKNNGIIIRDGTKWRPIYPSVD